MLQAGRELRLPLELGPREERPFQVLAEVVNELPRGQGIVLEATLWDQQGERVAGSLGLILTGTEA